MTGVMNAVIGSYKKEFADVVWTSPTIYTQALYNFGGGDVFLTPGGGGWYGAYVSGVTGGISATLNVVQEGSPTPSVYVSVAQGNHSLAYPNISMNVASLYGGSSIITLRATGEGGKTADITLEFSYLNYS